MKHARKDYNQRIQDSANIIPADEPVFLLRAKDQVAASTVRTWAHQHRLNGGSDLVYVMVMRHADLMEAWGQKHGTKLADVPSGMDDTV